MAVIDELFIVNAACAQFGDDPIEDLTADTIGGQPAALLYQALVDFNLGIYPWSFGKQLFTLSRDDTVTSLVGYTHVYDLPAERLEAPIFITDDVSRPARRFTAFHLVNGQVHTNAAALAAECKFRPAPHLWSAAFRQATITALASRLAIARAHDKTLGEQLKRDAYGTASEEWKGGQMRAAIAADSYGSDWRAQDRSNNPLEQSWVG